MKHNTNQRIVPFVVTLVSIFLIITVVVLTDRKFDRYDEERKLYQKELENKFSEVYDWETCDDEYVLIFNDYDEIIIDNDYNYLEYRLNGDDLYIILYENDNGDIFEFEIFGDYTFSCITDR